MRAFPAHVIVRYFHDMPREKQEKFDDYIHADDGIRQRLRGTIGHASAGRSIFTTSTTGNPAI